jgi:hypothetical protein
MIHLLKANPRVFADIGFVSMWWVCAVPAYIAAKHGIAGLRE